MTCINHEKDVFEGQQRSFFMAKSRGLVACCNHETHRPCSTLSAGQQQKTDWDPQGVTKVHHDVLSLILFCIQDGFLLNCVELSVEM